MAEEIERVRTEIFQLEMKGVITPKQKTAIKNEIEVLLQDASRKRDALIVQDIQKVDARLEDIRLSKPANLFGYFKEVFIEGRQTVFTIFDALGIILFLFPTLAQSLVSNVSLTRIVGGLIFFASFLWANYTLYINCQS